MYGIQAWSTGIEDLDAFENDVKMYGIQASHRHIFDSVFENDVKMYGIQASILN